MVPDELAEYPPILKHSTESPDIVYRRAPELVAVRGAPSRARLDPPVLAVEGDQGESVRVYRASAEDRQAPPGSRSMTAVYTLAPGRLAVPTGRVFVRFREDVVPAARSDDLQRAGYRIAQTLAYAPSAAWLEADDGEVASALRNIDKLEQMTGMVNVEPQLLAPRATR